MTIPPKKRKAESQALRIVAADLNAKKRKVRRWVLGIGNIHFLHNNLHVLSRQLRFHKKQYRLLLEEFE